MKDDTELIEKIKDETISYDGLGKEIHTHHFLRCKAKTIIALIRAHDALTVPSVNPHNEAQDHSS